VVNYEELDRILDTVEEVFSSLANQYGYYELKHWSTERWRWDEPVITLTSVGRDDVNRNIHALTIQEGSYPYELLVEINAWQDEDEAEGEIRMRKWQHAKVGRVQIPLDTEQLEGMIRKAYDNVSRWREGKLARKTRLASWAGGPEP